MLVVSVQTLIEQAVESFKAHQYTGNILSVSEFLREENITKLEDAFDGVFAFLAFHPGTDQPVVDYVRAGSLASDSGRHVLVLFILSDTALWPKPITETSLGTWLELDMATHPSYQFVEALFENCPPPILPGIVFFCRFTDSIDPVFVSLQGLATKEVVRSRLQTAFSAAAKVHSRYGRDPSRFSNHLCIELEVQRIPYTRVGRTPIRAWLVKVFQLAWLHKGDVVSAVKLLK